MKKKTNDFFYSFAEKKALSLVQKKYWYNALFIIYSLAHIKCTYILSILTTLNLLVSVILFIVLQKNAQKFKSKDLVGNKKHLVI